MYTDTTEPALDPDGWGFLDTRGEIPDQEYVVDRIVPEGEVSMMFAAAGDGKSMTALYMAYCITTGAKFYNLTTKPGPVLYIDSETHSRTARRRLSRILDGPAATEILYIQKPGLLRDDAVIEKILDYVKSKGVKPVLTIIDSLQSATFIDNLDANQIIAIFAQLNEAFGTVLVLDHTPLDNDGRPIGSSFKKNCVRSLFGLRTKAHEGGEDEDDSMTVRFAQSKVNDDKPLMGCGGTMWFEDERGKGHIRFEPMTKDEAVKAIREDRVFEWLGCCGGAEVKLADIQAAFSPDIDPDQVSTLLSHLKAEGRVLNPRRGWWCVLGFTDTLTADMTATSVVRDAKKEVVGAPPARVPNN